jgi:hypothetical protein
MPTLYLVANSVLFTTYGHIQFVYDADDTFENGDAKEIEVQPTSLGSGDWLGCQPGAGHDHPIRSGRQGD